MTDRRPQEITDTIRRYADDADTALAREEVFAAIIGPVTDALRDAADLLDQQQRFLIELRNWKADA